MRSYGWTETAIQGVWGSIALGLVVLIPEVLDRLVVMEVAKDLEGHLADGVERHSGKDRVAPFLA
jgi:hypothetical protein